VSDDLLVCQLGTIAYREAHDLQLRLRTARQAGVIGDVLLLLDHPPVYTRGRRTGPSDLPLGEAWYRARGIDVVDADRGGRVTYHGPGLLTGYPIMRVDDVHGFVATMERAIVAALGDAGVAARVREGLTGVWAGERKIGSIGLHVSRGVTTHGFAVNADNDLAPWEWIVPCGLEGVSMTSVARERSRGGVAEGDPTMPCLRRHVAFRFAEAHGRRQRLVGRGRLERALARPAGPAPEPAPVAFA